MSEILSINALLRERAGKGAARATRRGGRIPAIIYGNKQNPIAISLDPIEMMHYLRGSFFAHVYEIKIDGVKSERVLARDVQLHPVTDDPLHIDFMRFSKTTKVNIEVECHFLNEDKSPGLIRGGVLNVVRYKVELVCSPNAIPEFIDIDLSGLEIGDTVHISAVQLPEGVAPVIDDRDFTIATIAAPTVVNDETALVDEVGESEAEPGTSEGQ